MSLEEIFRKHGCDKADHGYSRFYERLPEPERLLEVGVYKGASLRAWHEFWPGSAVVGLDTFQRGGDDIFIEGCLIMKADSRITGALVPWQKEFLLVIDDGSHRPRDQAATFRNLWPLVAPGGLYVIEDVYVGPWDEKAPKWFADRSEHFSREAYKELISTVYDDNKNAGGFGLRDFRRVSGKPDSVLLPLRKPC